MRLVINSTRVHVHPIDGGSILPHKNFHFKTRRHRVVVMALFLSYGRACVRNRANSMCVPEVIYLNMYALVFDAPPPLLLRMLCCAMLFGLFVLVTCSWIISHVNRSSVLYVQYTWEPRRPTNDTHRSAPKLYAFDGWNIVCAFVLSIKRGTPKCTSLNTAYVHIPTNKTMKLNQQQNVIRAQCAEITNQYQAKPASTKCS